MPTRKSAASRKNIPLKRLVGFLDDTLDVASFKRDSSLNGLQVEGRSRVGRVTLAVDACEESILQAIRSRSDMLIVHHGLFWGGPVPITGITAKRLSLLLGRGISLYAAHLPLDCHPEIGNNALLASALGIDRTEKFGEYAGYVIGLCGALPVSISASGFAAKVRRLTGAPVRSFRSGRERIRKIGIVSGGGASMLKDAAEAGCERSCPSRCLIRSHARVEKHNPRVFNLPSLVESRAAGLRESLRIQRRSQHRGANKYG